MPPRVWKLIAAVVVVIAATVGSIRLFHLINSPPETPGNAVLAFTGKVISKNYNGAWSRVCSALKADAFALHDDAAVVQGTDRFAALQTLLRFQADIYTNYETEIDGDTARATVDVRPWGVKDDRSNEKWIITLVKEDGKWRICGSERAAS